MIAITTIEKLVRERLDEKMFIVEISVSKSNAIRVYVDGFDGITIEQCIAISRNVEHNLDREEEDFELEVSSPGLTESFKVLEQYIKYTGREIEVLPEEGEKLTGLLKVADENGIVLETSKREKVEGHKKKQLVVKDYKFKYNEIKSAKAVISFK
ncbi:ribosome assembly cofactor RimP [Maribellus sediminis]|uniref:ribosome assembly cofactor RimP n=1 Tax=Maribellus sediminis TaxID=2696285 RepID=UPI0014316C62|nr:ribosome assembly cofactor RimP [Maribellus sediminis]